MTNRSRAKGTLGESAVVDYFRQRGWKYAERRALNGNLDRGDLAGVPGLVAEIKNCKTIDLAGWTREAAVEKRNDGADLGVVIAKKRGTTNAADWYAILTVAELCDLLTAAGYGGTPRDELEQAS